MKNHLPFIKLPCGKDSIAYCSYLTPKKLIVFVHGFNGSATKTWLNFPSLIINHEKCKEADIIFYGYDSLRQQSNNMKLELYNMLDKINAYTGFYFYNRKSSIKHEYDEIILVAHSLGAIVCRLAIIHAIDNNKNWSDKCKMALYAPAHFGSRIVTNFKECFNFNLLGNLFKGYSLTKYPIIGELDYNSTTIKNLLVRSNNLTANNMNQSINAELIVWALTETVVINDTFCNDNPDVKYIPGSIHTSVCKPNNYNLNRPFDELINIL
ncbi:esterase/lipase family protein [Flavobacterium sp.]|uniref:esterase/lipase family protein n=1 Tax=Flavobacterium sp. TaxID=239 RepID=UPI00391A683D